MGGIVSTIFGGGIEGAGKAIAAVIDAIRGKNPEDAAKLQQLLEESNQLAMKYQSEFALAKIDENVQLNKIAGENVRADAQSGDLFTARARPAILWVGLGVIVWNYCFMPVLLLHWRFTPITLPDWFWGGHSSSRLAWRWIRRGTSRSTQYPVLSTQSGNSEY
jgi:hypothetical protein